MRRLRESFSKRACAWSRLLEHIDRRLDQQLELDALARVANFSSFHFHRLFTAWFGETLGDYVRRRRLETAALRLVAQPRLPVLQVALSVGFGSTEAFARAFKARFGSTPTQSRDSQRSNRDQLNSKLGQDLARPPRNDGRMKVTIVARKPTPVAYLRHVGPYRKPVSEFWMNRVDPWMEPMGSTAARGTASATTTRVSPHQRSCAMTPRWRCRRASSGPGITRRPSFPEAGTRRASSRAPTKRLVKRGRGCCAIGSQAAACSSTRVRSSSTTRWTRPTTARPASSSARSASRSRRFDGRPRSRGRG